MDISQVSFNNHTLTWRLNVLMFGLIAGAISSLCVSSLILLTEKVIGIPVGTFYLIIIDALITFFLHLSNICNLRFHSAHSNWNFTGIHYRYSIFEKQAIFRKVNKVF